MKALAELFRRAGPSQRVAGTSAYTLDHLRRFFGRRLPESSTIVDYVRHRQKKGASIQTINEELWSLAWMFRCALQQGKVKQEDCPRIEFLKEPRTHVTHSLDSRAQTERHRTFITKVTGDAERPAVPKERGKLTQTALNVHLEKHPIDKLGPNGQLLSDNKRLEFLRTEQEIDISRTTLLRRLRHLRPKPRR